MELLKTENGPQEAGESGAQDAKPRKHYEKETAPPRRLTDTDIVAGLRHDDHGVRQAALEALYPHGSGAVLIHSKKDVAQITATTRVDAGRVFNALLWLSQNVGKHLGLALHWVPEQVVEDPNKIQIVPGDALPPR